MLERFKITGSSTRLGLLCRAVAGSGWDASVGGDKNESVLYRLDQGLRVVLSKYGTDIKLVVLASGTNNLHPKHGFKAKDLESWSALLHECLALASNAEVLVCDVFHRTDILDSVIEAANVQLKAVVNGLDARDRARVVWVEARHVITKNMLVDHVHLNEEGYAVWDKVLWPFVQGVLEGGDADGNSARQEEANSNSTREGEGRWNNS